MLIPRFYFDPVRKWFNRPCEYDCPRCYHHQIKNTQRFKGVCNNSTLTTFDCIIDQEKSNRHDKGLVSGCWLSK